MASIINIKKKILIDFLYLTQNKNLKHDEFKDTYNKLPLYDINQLVYERINNLNRNYCCFNLGIAFGWFTEHSTNDEANGSIAAIDEICAMFDIKEPIEEEEEVETEDIESSHKVHIELRGETYENN